MVDKGISQEDLAAIVGKDQQSISKNENGKRRLSVIDLPALAAAPSVPVAFFFDETTETPELDQAVVHYFHELLTFKIPPPPWEPPKRRGRPPKLVLAGIP